MYVLLQSWLLKGVQVPGWCRKAETRNMLLVHTSLHFGPFCSVAKLCLTLCDPMDFSTPGFPVLHYLSEFAQTHGVGDAIQPFHPLSSPSPPALNPSQNEGLFHEWALRIRWPKYWSFSFSLSNEYSGLISPRIDWFDLLAAPGTLKSIFFKEVRQKYKVRKTKGDED